MKCREKCGACCIIPSISSPLPALPHGKPEYVPCPHLDEDYRCTIFNSPERPKVCANFKAEKQICGENREDAIRNLTFLQED